VEDSGGLIYDRGMLHPTYPIFTDRLALRPFRDADLDALHAIHSRPDVVRYLYWEPRSRDDAQEMLQRRKLEVAIIREGEGLHLAADLRATGELIGQFNLFFVSQQHRLGEIGFVVHPDHHGRGYATEGIRPLIRLGFEELGLHRIIGRCDARNDASARVMERLGMRREAHFVENEFVKGEWTDGLEYAMLDREWRALAGREESPSA
jgi:RimJ/RimL family protein N-acetyltransferase